nr:DUF1934 family protein [Bacillus velezensis]
MRQETPVAIHVQSFIHNGSEEESVEFTSSGFYYVRNGKTYLSYHEEHDLGKIKTVVKITEKEILVMRSGAIQMKQRFIPGHRHSLNINCRSDKWSSVRKRKHSI